MTQSGLLVHGGYVGFREWRELQEHAANTGNVSSNCNLEAIGCYARHALQVLSNIKLCSAAAIEVPLEAVVTTSRCELCPRTCSFKGHIKLSGEEL